jgi:ABC-2 type transport system ATP-binding protein
MCAYGVGKTTTLRALLGLIRPDAGTAQIAGCRYAELADPGRTVGALLDAAAHPVGLYYCIWPGRTSRLGSSLSDHFGRLRSYVVCSAA